MRGSAARVIDQGSATHIYRVTRRGRRGGTSRKGDHPTDVQGRKKSPEKPNARAPRHPSCLPRLTAATYEVTRRKRGRSTARGGTPRISANRLDEGVPGNSLIPRRERARPPRPEGTCSLGRARQQLKPFVLVVPGRVEVARAHSTQPAAAGRRPLSSVVIRNLESTAVNLLSVCHVRE